MNLSLNHEYLAVRRVLLAQNLLIHLMRFLKKRQGVLEVASLHVAVAQQGQNVRVILLRHLDFGEELAVQFQSRGQVVQSLLEVLVFEIGFAELGVCCHQDEQVFFVDVDEELAEGELLDADLDHFGGVFRDRVLIEGLVSLD